MTTSNLLNWMWQSTLLLSGGWLLYFLLLRQEARLRYNRAYLLLLPVLAAAGLLLPWAQWWPVAVVFRTVGMPTVLLPALRITATGAAAAPAGTLPWPLLLYGAGVVLSLLLLATRLLRLWRLTRRLPAEARPGYTLRLTGGRLPVSSFGRTVYWDETAPLPAADAARLLAHELAHVRQGHSADLLWLQLWQAVLWFSPAVYLLGRALCLTHEYLADAATVQQTPTDSAAAYGRLLARQATQRWQPAPLAHAFATPNTLHRIAMLHRHPSARTWRQWLALPVLGALLGLVACEQLAAFGPPPPPPPPPAPGPPPPPPPPMLGLKIGADKAYTFVEQMPEYPGGTAQLMTDLSQLVKYPAAARAEKLTGRVFIRFLVTADGTIQEARVAKGISYPITYPGSDGKAAATTIVTPGAEAMNQAALDAVRRLPGRWQPGRQDGQAVNVLYTIPISFEL